MNLEGKCILAYILVVGTEFVSRINPVSHNWNAILHKTKRGTGERLGYLKEQFIHSVGYLFMAR